MSTRNLRPFVHLRALSSYSLGHGLSTPAELCRHAQRIGFDAMALTDVGGTYGFVEFHRAARECGIKPIYGTLLVLDEELAGTDAAHTLILLAFDRAGLRNVCAAATVSATRRERREPFTTIDLETRSDGVVAIAGVASRGEFSPTVLMSLRDIFGDRLFLEAREAAPPRTTADLGIAPVLVQDVRFAGSERHPHDDLAGLAAERAFEHRVFSDPRLDVAGAGGGMRSAAEMSPAYDAQPEAHTNAALIAALVQPDLLDGIDATVRDSGTQAEMFGAASNASRALRARVDDALEKLPGGADDAAARRDRVAHELDMLDSAGLGETMLQFADVVGHMRRAGATVGPATGLSLQSLCAYLLGLTTFDPYARHAGFRPRFDAVKGRVLDMQTAPEFRARVVGSLNRVFDGAGIGYVPSVEHTTAARALRIVARWMGEVPRDVDDAIKIASRHHGATLRELSEENRAFGTAYRKSAAFRDIVARAAAIEGLPFGFARTKRSVIVAPKPLRASFAFSVDPETGDRFVQSTRDSFPIGDIRRVDIATLQALSVVGHVVGEAGGDDASAFELIARGDLDGVYLLEAAPGRIASEFGIRSFDDLVHFVALLRQRRTGVPLAQRAVAFRGAEVSLPAAEHLAGALAETHGRLLFEDQAGEVIARLTGVSGDQADELARRFEDHSPGNLATLRRDFLALTVETGVPFDAATEWFGRLLRHAAVALDRRRIMADALIVRACLVLKARSRAEFFARTLDGRIDTDKRMRYQSTLEAESRWLPPSVRDSGRRHLVVGERVRAPLWVIAGVTRDASDAIMRMQPNERAATDDEFRLAASKIGVNFETVDALIRAGAFGIAAEVKVKGSGLPEPFVVSTAANEQMNMTFVDTVAAGSSASDPSPARGPSSKKDGNSRHGFRVVASLSEFYPHPSATPVELAGRIRNLRDFKTSSGKTVGFFELFDSSGSVRVFVPWERVARLGEPLSDGCHVIVTGKVRLRDGRKVCDALEIVLTEGGNGHGETSPDDPSKGDP